MWRRMGCCNNIGREWVATLPQAAVLIQNLGGEGTATRDLDKTA